MMFNDAWNEYYYALVGGNTAKEPLPVNSVDSALSNLRAEHVGDIARLQAENDKLQAGLVAEIHRLNDAREEIARLKAQVAELTSELTESDKRPLPFE